MKALTSIGRLASQRLLMLCLCALACLAGLEPAFAQDFAATTKITVIHDTNSVGYWRREFDAALHAFLADQTQLGQSYSLSIEYTGINRYPQGRSDSVINLLRDHQNQEPAELVIAVLDPAVDFLQQYGEEIYPGIPTIFYLSGEIPPGTDATLSNSEHYYLQGDIGIPIAETLQLIPRMIPELETISIVSGVGSFGAAFTQSAREQLREISLDAEINFIEGDPADELRARFQNQDPANNAILFLSYNIDANGNAINATDAVSDLSSSLSIPIFGVFDSVLGRGIVGGYMNRSRVSAQQVGEMAVSILANEPTAVAERLHNYYFDGRQLDRFNFDRGTLPAGSIIEFDNFSVWRTYRSEILIAALVILVQALLILALVVSLRRQRIVDQALKAQADDLATQKNLFESVINSIHDAIVISDVNRKIYAANASIKGIFDFEPNEIIGMNSYELIDTGVENNKQDETVLQPVEDSLEPTILQYRKRNGELFSGETIGTKIISSTGEVLGYFSLIRDVSQRLSREQEMQQSQKMEALGNLVGGIAHDFNNVLGVISAYAEVLHFKEQKPDSKSNLEKILNATQRGADLCNQIMSFSRDMSVEQTRINLLDVVNETIKLLGATIPSRIKLSLDCAEEVYPVYANSTQLQQVILNLATNAAHAIGDEPGKLSISVQSESVREQRILSQGLLGKGDYVVLKLADTGCGINEDNFDKIFEPFFTTRIGEGTGMGMAMVYKIVRAHGGTIDLKSVLGEGTEICIYFPELEEKTNLAAEVDDTLIRGSGEHILLVDDEVDLLESVEMLLSTIGYSVEAHTDSLEALKSFRRQPQRFDLVISDQTMPGLNGTRLMQSMRELRADLPMILCTGYSDVLDKNNEYQAELSSVMRKPFTAAEMSRTIDQALAAPSENLL